MKLSEIIIELTKELASRGDRLIVQKYGEIYLEVENVTVYVGPYDKPDAGNLIFELSDP
jgi:hypothetical protein